MSINIPRYSGSLQTGDNMTGIYRARVEDNTDPHGIGRVRVRIPMLHGSDKKTSSYIPMESLPWATPSFLGAGSGYGSYIVPEVGEFVLVAFEGGNTDSPVYLGSCYGTGSSGKVFGTLEDNGGVGTVVSDGESESPVRNVNNSRKILYRSLKGASFEMDDCVNAESISMNDALGQSVKMYSSSGKSKSSRVNSSRSTSDNTDASVEISGVLGQKVLIESKGSDSIVTVTNGNITMRLSSSGGNDIAEVINGDVKITSSSRDSSHSIVTKDTSIVSKDSTIKLSENGGAYVTISNGSCKLKGKRGTVVI